MCFCVFSKDCYPCPFQQIPGPSNFTTNSSKILFICPFPLAYEEHVPLSLVCLNLPFMWFSFSCSLRMRFCFVYQRRIQGKGLGKGYVHIMSNEQQTIERKGHLGGTPAGLGNYRTRQILYISVLFLWAIALCICRLSLFHNYSIPVLLRVVRQLCYPLVEDAVGACWYVGQPGQGPQPLKENIF